MELKENLFFQSEEEIAAFPTEQDARSEKIDLSFAQFDSIHRQVDNDIDNVGQGGDFEVHANGESSKIQSRTKKKPMQKILI